MTHGHPHRETTCICNEKLHTRDSVIKILSMIVSRSLQFSEDAGLSGTNKNSYIDSSF